MATGLENPFLRGARSIGLGSTMDSLAERFDNTEAVDAGNRGEYGRALLRAGGDILGATGDILAAPFAAAFELTGLDKAIQGLIQKGLDTETGRELVKLAQENPEYAKDIVSLVDIVSVVPAAKLSKETINDVFHNMKTKVEGGVVGDVVQKARTKLAESQGKDAPEKPNFYNSPQAPLVAGEAVDSILNVLNDRFNPVQRATTRASGIPTGKRKEVARLLQKGKSGDAIAELATARMMQGQRYGQTPALFNKGSPLERYTYVATDVPATDLDRLGELIGGRDIPKAVVDRQLNDFKQSQLKEGLFNRPSQGTMVDIYNPNTRNAGSEFANQPMDQAPGSALHKMFKEDRINALPEGTTPFELMKAAKTADNLLGQQGVIERLRKGPRLDLGGKVEATRYILKALDKQKQGKKLTEKEVKALAAYEKTPLNKADEFGFQHGASSHVSALKELGGIRDVSSMQGMDKLYMSMTDKNDIFGSNFLFPKQDRASIFPIQERNLREARGTTDARLERYLTKKDVNQLIPTTEVEKISGVPKQKGENAVDYQLRAIAEMRKKPELSDYADVLKNVLLTTYVGSSNIE